MNFLILAFLFLPLPVPATAAGAGSVTLLEGPLRVIRGTNMMQGAEGMQVRQGDILESSDRGLVQMEFADGTIVALGPSSRLYILRSQSGAELVLLSGWMKAESPASSVGYKYETPSLAVTTGNGALVFHSDESGCDLFVESGAATISEVSSDAYARLPKPGKGGQFFSRRTGKSVTTLARPSPAFIDAMPQPFRDTLPSRLAHFKGKPIEAKVQHPVTYEDIEGWLRMPAAWRKGFVDRFEPRLKDAAFRRQIEDHVREHPEWDKILHPEKHAPGNAPSAAPNS